MKKNNTTKVSKRTGSSATKKTRRTTYVAVTNNVYHDGTSYRVRVSVNGMKFSKNFSSKRKAIAYRNELLSA
jgi:ribosomal protein L28